MRRLAGRLLPILVYGAVSLLVIGPLLPSRYIFTLDMGWGPRYPPPNLFYGFEPPIFGGFLPFLGIVKLLQLALPPWVVQKVVLFLVFLLSGLGAHYLVPAKSPLPRYFAGLFYMLNPFIYVRVLVGHLLLLLAYSFTPFAVAAFRDWLNRPGRRNTFRVVLFTTLVGFEIHMLVFNLFVYLLLAAWKLAGERKKKALARQMALPTAGLAAAWALVNAYWLLPLAFSSQESLLPAMGVQDLEVFTSRPGNFNALFTSASLYGFWRGGYIYARDLFPGWPFILAILIFLAVLGLTSHHRRPEARALALAGGVGLLLGAGLYGPGRWAWESSVSYVPVLGGFRDTHKFVAMLALAYAYLGGLGVAEVERVAHGRWPRCLTALLLVLPLAYSFTSFGFWGQLRPTDYPRDWYEADRTLREDQGDYNVLFLPWHQYMDFGWVPNRQKRIMSPASLFFSRPAIQAINLELPGISGQSPNPGQSYVTGLLAEAAARKDLGARLRPLNVKYVILAKEADYQGYAFLYDQADLELVRDGSTLVLFRNRHRVSAFYEMNDREEPAVWHALEYQKLSPVRYQAGAVTLSRIVFAPPNQDSASWQLEGQPSLREGAYAVYPAVGNTVSYRPFRLYFASYSLAGAALLAVMVWWGWGRWRPSSAAAPGGNPQPPQPPPPPER